MCTYCHYASCSLDLFWGSFLFLFLLFVFYDLMYIFISMFEFLLYFVGAAAAKSLQSCPTVCDPMDCSPPGSSVHGIFQARVLEWSAIAFSNFVGIFTILWVYLLFFFYLWLSWGLYIVIYLYRVIFNWWSLNFKHFIAPTFLPSSSCSYWFWHHVLHLIILSIPQLLIVNKDDFTTFAF